MKDAIKLNIWKLCDNSPNMTSSLFFLLNALLFDISYKLDLVALKVISGMFLFLIFLIVFFELFLGTLGISRKWHRERYFELLKIFENKKK